MRLARKRNLFIAIAIVVLAVIIYANLRPKAPKGPEVRSEQIETHKIEAWVRAPGRIQPVTQVQISSNVMGRVSEMAVEEGQRVRRGDLLLRLDDERYRSLVQQYRAQIQAADANRVLSEAELREANQTLERVRGMRERGLASEQEFLAAQTRAEVNAARVSAASEEIHRAQAALEQAEKDLRETVFDAPMDGVVTALNVEEGENVVTGTMNNPGTVILTLSDLSAMEVVSEVDETDVINVAVDQKARVLVDAMPDTTLGGVVTRVGQSGLTQGGAQQEATNYEVGVRLDLPPSDLRPGMNADVEILTGKRDDVLAVPLQALTARPPSVVGRWQKSRAKGEEDNPDEEADPDEEEEPDTTAFADRNLIEGVFLIEEDKARFVPVGLGLRGETHIEVFGDLSVGGTLIVGPFRTLRTLRDQQTVRAAKKKGDAEAADAATEEGAD